MNRITLEVPVETLGEAIAAVRAGADRLELCASLDVGGVTPSLETLAQFAEHAPVPFVVMIRPRGGEFYYDEGEAQAMERSISDAISHGAEGVVFGALLENGAIDLSLCRRLVAAAHPMYSVFHRAIDFVDDIHEAIAQIIDLGFTRILTSGGGASVSDPGAVERLAHLIDRAAGRIEILPGGGVRPGNAASLIRATQCRSVHSSCRRSDAGKLQFDPVLVAELRQVIDHLP